MDAITTPTLPEDAIDTIAAHFKGKRLDLFLESIAVIRESLGQGTWVKRGHQRASKGLSKGLASHKALRDVDLPHNDPRRPALFRCYMSIRHDVFPTQAELDVATDADLLAIAPKVPLEVTRAWLRLMVALREIFEDLDASRPLPVYTEIGLSPKVTQTLLDATVDLDLTTRRMCPIGWRWGTAKDKYGKPYRIKVYFPEWPAGTVFGSSRFALCDCQACGKTIPSGRVVPVLIADRSGTEHGFWFGCDCARNILGIKDVGLKRRPE